MRVDISLLPALAAAFMLVFARIGAMVMLLPGLGESNIPVRIKLAIALVLTLVILPLHRAAYHIDLQSLAPLLVLMVQEIVIGIVLGATARVTLAALQVAGSVIAQQLGLWFVTAAGTLLLSTFSGSIGGGIVMPLRNLVANSWMIHADGPGLMGLAKSLEYVLIAVLG